MLALAASALCSSVWNIASARFHSPCDAYYSRITTRLHNSLSFLLRLICSSRTRPFVWVQYTRTLFVFAFAKMSKVKSVCTCESIYAPALCGICVSAKCGVQNLTDRKVRQRGTNRATRVSVHYFADFFGAVSTTPATASTAARNALRTTLEKPYLSKGTKTRFLFSVR